MSEHRLPKAVLTDLGGDKSRATALCVVLVGAFLLLVALIVVFGGTAPPQPTHRVQASVLRLTDACVDSGCSMSGLFQDNRGRRYSVDFGRDDSVWRYIAIGDSVTLKILPDNSVQEADFRGHVSCVGTEQGC